GRLKALLERMFRRPAEFAVELGKVDGIAKIMSRTIGHERDQLAMRRPCRALPEAIHDLADRANDVNVAAFCTAADVVALAKTTLLEHSYQSLCVVVDIKPIADVEASSINRHLFAGEPLDDGQRDQLLGELIGAIVVRAVGDKDGQTKSVPPRAHEMIGG